jgi:DNA mismatch repair protein MutS
MTVRAKTLFATHYHELTSLGESLPTVQNVHVAGDERDGDVTFMRTVRDGPTNRSYGVHVADLAGVPEPVVDRSREVLDRLREDKAIEVRGGDSGGETTQAVFDLASGQFGGASADGGSGPDASDAGSAADPLDPASEAVLEELRDLDVNETPPVELLAKVQGWQDDLDDS